VQVQSLYSIKSSGLYAAMEISSSHKVNETSRLKLLEGKKYRPIQASISRATALGQGQSLSFIPVIMWNGTSGKAPELVRIQPPLLVKLVSPQKVRSLGELWCRVYCQNEAG